MESDACKGAGEKKRDLDSPGGDDDDEEELHPFEK